MSHYASHDDEPKLSAQLLSFYQELALWHRGRYPTRHLSPSDSFYILQWAASGLSAQSFIAAFDLILAKKPSPYEHSLSFSSLDAPAQRVIAEHQHRVFDVATQPAFDAYNPYEALLKALTKVGLATQHNPLLREKLREIFKPLRQAQREAEETRPDWSKDFSAFLSLKAEAFRLWESSCQTLFEACKGMLAVQELATLERLTPWEELQLLTLGLEGREHFRAQRLKEKIAVFFGLESLLQLKV